MYELIVLSLLMRGPLHGYLIVKIVNDMIGPWAKISSGTLYPLLTRMEKAGVISVVKSASAPVAGERQTRTFMITEEGRKRFHQVMMDMSSNLGDYQNIFRYKMGFIDLLQPQERLLLFNHYINYCQTSILHLQTEMASLAHELSSPPYRRFLENVLRVMEHVERQTQAELDWVRGLCEQELARRESLSSDALSSAVSSNGPKKSGSG
jgi:DNA-binding PadR family transcriptional regulator